MKFYLMPILFLGLMLNIQALSITRIKKTKFMDLNEFKVVPGGPREASLEKIVWKNHWDAISKACSGFYGNGAKYIISFRETGAPSIKRIAMGAKPKPHTILEKSIKEKTMSQIYGADWAKETQAFFGLVEGLVGHYSTGPVSLLGLRTDGAKGTKIIEYDPANKFSYLPLKDAIEVLSKNKTDVGSFYTGDYDLHEIYSNAKKLIPEATPEKITALNKLNEAISKADPKRTGEFEVKDGLITHSHNIPYEYGMIQHGDQSTYKMNQHLEAKNSGKALNVVDEVNNESPDPLGWNVKGEWYVTNNLVEHRAFRKLLEIQAPAHWTDPVVTTKRDPNALKDTIQAGREKMKNTP